jgi:hypothetical protein
MYTKQCDRCKRPVELKDKPLQPGFLCNSCCLLWEDKKREYKDKMDLLEMRKKFIDFINFGSNFRNIILK